MFGRPKKPKPPLGVRLVDPDGFTLDMVLTYEGVTGDGMHHWTAVPAAPIRMSEDSKVTIRKLPPMTHVTAKFKVKEEG